MHTYWGSSSTQNWENLTEDPYYQVEMWEDNAEDVLKQVYDDAFWNSVGDVQLAKQIPQNNPTVHLEFDANESDAAHILLLLQSLGISATSALTE